MKEWLQNNLRSSLEFYPEKISKPYGWVEHTPFMAILIEKTAPKIYVELGVHTGNSYFAACQVVKKLSLPTKCFAIDTWEGDIHAGFYENNIFDQVNNYNKSNYSEFSNLLRIKFDDALSCFEDGSIDILHIDGMHTYEAVKHDFETWHPKLAPGAIVLFHDIAERGNDFGVWKLWDELTQRYSQHFSFNHSHGLGILQIESDINRDNMSFIFEAIDDGSLLRNFFEALGSRISSKIYSEEFKLKEINYHSQLEDYHNLAIILNEKIVEYHNALTNRELLLRQLVTSKSWVLTKPLRDMMRVIYKIFR